MILFTHLDNLGPVSFTKSQRAKYQRITIRPDKTITVTIPRNGSLNEAKQFLQSKTDWVRKQLRKIDQHAKMQYAPDLNIDLEETQKKLFVRLEHFSKKYHMPYNRATFRCQRTRWGSCSGENNISLNINIVFLPEELRNYVLLHELVHTKVKNHSRKFWAELDKYTKDRAKELSKELKNYRIKLRV